jgi:ankyrin repeat protein
MGRLKIIGYGNKLEGYTCPVHNWSPAHIALFNSHVEVLEVLLSEEMANQSFPDSLGLRIRASQPLHWAAGQGDLDMVRVLTNAGASVALRGMMGDTPMHWAVGNGHLDVIRCLKWLGADVSARDKYGDSPMHEAASLGKLDVIKALADLGADVSVKNLKGITPMDSAKFGRYEVAVRELLWQLGARE